MPIWILLSMMFSADVSTAPAAIDVHGIIQRSVAVTQADWKAAPAYPFHEVDHEAEGTKTYAVTMVLGTPYRRLIAIDDRPLSGAEEKKQERLAHEATLQRSEESQSERATRTARYEKERRSDQQMMLQLASAFDFTPTGQGRIGDYDVYVLKATPKKDYRPPNYESRVLTGMEGTLWIDKKTFQWVKVEAKVIHPVSIAGFLARVEPGTRFELEKAPVGDGIWLPTHFSMKSRARVLELVERRHEEDTTFSDYHRAGEPDSSRKTGTP